ncbi:MAG: CpsD/CapB family tyrosine-protein kinase [Phycisphaerales bacterium]
MFAAAGAMAGGGAAFGLVGLLGLLGGGFRYIDEIDEKSSQLLGVIPDLGGRREPTPEAALCIHHARAMIDSRVPRVKERGRIIAVTSPTAGDGKTTVCCSLATSFAMAGFRTVVLDADFVGRGMTSRLEMDKAAGLADVLAGDDLESALAPGGTENLLIIGAGREERLSADRFSAARLAPVLERLSRAHDIVLVDSGPVLGSLEATVTVGLADAVLGVVSRGQSEKMFASMRRKLESLGAELTGVVFNRAMPRDFQHSTHTSVVSAQSQRSRTVQVPDFVTMGASGMAGRLPGGSGGASDAGGSGGGTGQWSSSRDRATAESD